MRGMRKVLAVSKANLSVVEGALQVWLPHLNLNSTSASKLRYLHLQTGSHSIGASWARLFLIITLYLNFTSSPVPIALVN